jgi:AcrR family transcriptional regulator
MQYVFRSKEQLLRSVIEDVVEEIAELLQQSAKLDDGLEHTIRQGMRDFWSQLVTGKPNLQLMQNELTT